MVHLEAVMFLSILFSYCSSGGFGTGIHLLREPYITDSHSTADFLAETTIAVILCVYLMQILLQVHKTFIST